MHYCIILLPPKSLLVQGELIAHFVSNFATLVVTSLLR